MVHGRGGTSRRLSFIVLTTSAFGAAAAVAPAQPIPALILPRKPTTADSDDAAQPAPAGTDVTRDAFAAALLSGDASARDAPRGVDTDEHIYDGTVSTEDNQLVGTAWGAGSWSLGGLAQQPRELPPRAGPGVPHEALPKPCEKSTTSGEASSAPGGGDSSRIAASVLAAVMPTAAALATEPGVASVGVHVSVAQALSVAPQPGGTVTLSRDWHVTASADVEVADASAAAAAAEAMAWQAAAVMDPNVIFLYVMPRPLPDDGSLLSGTASERALGLAVLAMMWVFVGVFIGRHMYSEEHEDDDFVFDDACCKPTAAASDSGGAGTSSPTTLNAAATRATAVAHQDSNELAPLPRAAEGSTSCVGQRRAPLPPPTLPYSVA